MARTGRPRIAHGRRSRDWLLARIVEQPNGCWLWTGDKSRRGGYGRVYIGLGENGRKRFESAAVAFHREFVGPVPEGAWLLHRCDNPPCCNPQHLFLGDHDDNMRDMVAKRRSAAGKRRLDVAKLTDDQVREIRASTESQRKLGARYRIDSSVICRIRTGHAYKGVR